MSALKKVNVLGIVTGIAMCASLALGLGLFGPLFGGTSGGVVEAQAAPKAGDKKAAEKKAADKKAADAKKAPAKGDGKAPAPASADGEEGEGEDGEAPAEGESPFDIARREHGRSLTRSTDPEVRKKAIEAYIASNDSRAVNPIAKVLADKKNPLPEKLRYHTLELLGSMSNPEAVRRILLEISKWTDVERIYDNFLVFKGLAANAEVKVQEVVAGMIKDPAVAVWVKAAVLEAVAESRQAAYVPALTELIIKGGDLWDTTEAIIPISAFIALGNCYKHSANAKDRIPLLESLMGMLDTSTEKGFKSDRVRYFAAQAFADVARLKEATDDVWWMNWYIREIEKGTVGSDGQPPAERPTPPPSADGKPGEHKRRGTDRRPEFIGMRSVGRKLIYCVDLSDSMNEEIDPAIIEAAKQREARKPSITGGKKEGEDKEEEEEKLDWDNIKTKLDLAKAYLLRSLNQLAKAEEARRIAWEEFKKENKGVGGRSRTKGRHVLEEPYMFNIVVYATNARLLDEKTTKFVEATQREIDRFRVLVEEYTDGEGMTNIHGALLQSFRTTEDKPVVGDPAFDAVAITKGADTVFFLTDGWASWSDDSASLVWDPRITNPTVPTIGDGKYIMAADILLDFERLNRFRKIVVNTVGIGNHDKPLMQGMAAKSRGQYVDFSGKARRLQ